MYRPHDFDLYMEDFEPKWVNLILNINEVNSLRPSYIIINIWFLTLIKFEESNLVLSLKAKQERLPILYFIIVFAFF